MKLRELIREVVPEPVRTKSMDALDRYFFTRWLKRQDRPPVLPRPIFMIGCPRSGTSYSADLFGTHPDVADWSEAPLVWDPAGYYDIHAEHAWDAVRATPEVSSMLHARFDYFRRRKGKARFFNKHPRNSVRLGFIDRVFPDALFIHIIRDGRAVVNSILNRRNERDRRSIPFWNFCKPPDYRNFLRDDPVEQAALQWNEIMKDIYDKRPLLEGRYIEFKYEELCARPRDTFRRAFAFAGLPVDDQALIRIPETGRSMNYKFSESLTPVQLETISRIQGETLQRLGYTV